MNRNSFPNEKLIPRQHRYALAAIGVLLAGLGATAPAAEPDWSAYGQFLERHLSRRGAAGGPAGQGWPIYRTTGR